MNSKIGGSIAIALLAIYVYLVVLGCLTVDCALAPACTRHPVAAFNEGMAQYLAELGGLVSALVIAELAITRPGETPAVRMLEPHATDKARRRLRLVAIAYLVVWFFAGAAAFLFGLGHPLVLPPLTGVGQSWFGIAVAAAYAYLGVRPKKA
ncbi:MAG TPA: hypothetical protein VK753_11440 [Xanthomonadaceae bacterium]|jgi:hypothetical protein|nr:hypothetical protein [Xanthomonadaceae bacterium]